MKTVKFKIDIPILSTFVLYASQVIAQQGTVLPDRRSTIFKGTITETYKESKADFPMTREAPSDAPNIEKTVPFRFSLDETLDVGEDTGSPVSKDYKVPFKFNNTLKKGVIDLK